MKRTNERKREREKQARELTERELGNVVGGDNSGQIDPFTLPNKS